MKKGAANEGNYAGVIGLVALAVFLVVVAWVAVRVARKPVSTLGIGVALEATIACDAPAASRDVSPILARLGELGIDAVAAPTGAQRIAIRLAEDPGEDVLRAMLVRGDLAIAEVVESSPRRGTAQSLEALATRAPEGTRMLLACERVDAAPAEEDCQALFVRTPAVVRASDIDAAQMVLDPLDGSPRVTIALVHEAARRFEQVTRSMIGRRLAISIDDRVLSAPVVQDAIADGRASIAGESVEDTRALAIALSTRPLDCAWRIESLARPE